MALGLTRPRSAAEQDADRVLDRIDRERQFGPELMVRLDCRYRRRNGAPCDYHVIVQESREDWGAKIMRGHVERLHAAELAEAIAKGKGASDGTADSSGLQERAEEDRGEAGRLAEERRGDSGGEEPGRFRRGEG